MADYKMNGRDFEELFKMIDEYSLEKEYLLCLTEMNLYEIMKNYEHDIRKAFNQYKDFQREINRLVEDADEFDIANRENRRRLIQEFKNKVLKNFEIIIPTGNSLKRSIDRMYQQIRPFKENKEEIKDSIIWETIEEYAEDNSDSYVFFISNNHRDFAQEDSEKSYVLHEDFDDKEGRIKYYKNIRSFLTHGVDYLETHVFEHQDIDEIILELENLIDLDIPERLHSKIESYFYNNEFEADYFSGWGIDPTISSIIDVKQNEYNDVISTDENFIIPCVVELELEYSVETKSPFYERGDEDEYITSEPQFKELIIEFDVIYNKEKKKILDIESVDII